jgi:hypothetical protein
MTVLALSLGAIPALAAEKPASRYVARASYSRVFSPCAYVAHKNTETVLQLTDSQRADLAQAQAETVDAPALADLQYAARRHRSETALQEYRAGVKRAEAELEVRIQTILTPAQRELRGRINEAFRDLPNDTVKTCVDLLGARVKHRVRPLTAAEREKLIADLQARLAGVLTPAQQELVRGRAGGR